jgi:hypothetical protein
MDKVSLRGRAATSTKETSLRMKDKVKALCSGPTGVFMKVTGKKESSMDWEESCFLMELQRKECLKTMCTKPIKTQ